jgi:hypothetical protein
MSYAVDYRSFAAEWYYIKTKHGEFIPFIYNDVQNLWYDDLQATYGETLQGIRENDLKGRQFGISTVISAMFATDFILSAIGEIPMVDGVVYSHKDKETATHFARINMFIESYMLKCNGGDYANPAHRLEAQKLRPHFFATDTTNLLIAKNGTQIQTATAGAKVSGRGSTLQNIHWTEPAFYPNTPILSAESLITGAEEQVPENYGKIFRESTGNMMGDYFSKEYFLGKDGKSEFNSRFLAWYLHKPYTRPAPSDWAMPAYYLRVFEEGLATRDQCYWHYIKTRELQDKKKLREYPTKDIEAFLMAGTTFFDSEAMLYHNNRIRKPIKKSEYVESLSMAKA